MGRGRAIRWQMGKFKELQEEGICGRTQNNGALCPNKIIEWFTFVEGVGGSDSPDEEIRKMGVCGVHAAEVDAWTKNTNRYRNTALINKFLDHETQTAIKFLQSMGLACERHYGGGIVVLNVGFLLEWVRQNQWPVDYDDPARLDFQELDEKIQVLTKERNSLVAILEEMRSSKTGQSDT